jgi:hypothetical protein
MSLRARVDGWLEQRFGAGDPRGLGKQLHNCCRRT